MSDTIIERYQPPPEFWEGPAGEHRRFLAQSIGGLLRGESNALYEVTLEAGTSTVITGPRITQFSVALFSPKNALAAQYIDQIYFTATVGSVTLNHPAAAEGAVLGVVILG